VILPKQALAGEEPSFASGPCPWLHDAGVSEGWCHISCSGARQIELHTNTSKYPIGVHVLPKHLDEKVARLQLEKLSAELTLLTDHQARYIGVEQAGPYKTDHYRY
jgi:hypothetical protein